MKKQIFLAATALTFIVSSAFTPNPSDGFYRVDASESSIIWVGSKITGSSHEGTVDLQSGGVQVNNGRISEGKFAIDMTSITVTDMEGRMKEKLEGHLKNDDFFSVDKHKTANLTIIGGHDDEVKANLTIKGITQEVAFPVEITVVNGVLTAKAQIEVDRSKYDVRYGSESFFDNLGDKAINNIIRFEVKVVAKAA